MPDSFAPGAVRRIAKDAKEAMKGVTGIHYRHSTTCVDDAVAMIEGPADTPYSGGFFLFSIKYPANYPSTPPRLTFLTGDGVTRLHPNMYTKGKVCLSMLNTWTGDKWTPCMRILNVLLVLRSRFSDAPLLHEPGIPQQHAAVVPYTEAVRHATIRLAVLGLFTWTSADNDELKELLEIARKEIVDNPSRYRDIITRNEERFNKLREEDAVRSVVRIPGYKLVESIDYPGLRTALDTKLKKHIDT